MQARTLRSRSVSMKSTRSWSRSGSGPSCVSAPSAVHTGQLVLCAPPGAPHVQVASHTACQMLGENSAARL